MTRDCPIDQNGTVCDGSVFRSESSCIPSSEMLPSIRQDIPVIEPEHEVNIAEIIANWNLNVEQARAFHIVAEHSLQLRSEPLHMYLGGPGGTGKSRVIKALQYFLDSRAQSRQLRLTSYTGVAACNISGMTLHSASSIKQKHKSGPSNATHDLIAMWEGADYLFIDEISMIGCNFLVDISEALTAAKGNTTAFGGINVIFAGDFAQLPPIGQKRLFNHLDTRTVAQGGTKAGQKTILGKLLWLSVTQVVILDKVMRQFGPENEPFMKLLGRLRDGKCTDADTRTLQNSGENIAEKKWKDCPLIVSKNDVKDALNARGATAFAARTNQQLHWYYSTDKHSGKTLTDPALQ